MDLDPRSSARSRRRLETHRHNLPVDVSDLRLRADVLIRTRTRCHPIDRVAAALINLHARLLHDRISIGLADQTLYRIDPVGLFKMVALQHRRLHTIGLCADLVSRRPRPRADPRSACSIDPSCSRRYSISKLILVHLGRHSIELSCR